MAFVGVTDTLANYGAQRSSALIGAVARRVAGRSVRLTLQLFRLLVWRHVAIRNLRSVFRVAVLIVMFVVAHRLLQRILSIMPEKRMGLLLSSNEATTESNEPPQLLDSDLLGGGVMDRDTIAHYDLLMRKFVKRPVSSYMDSPP